MVMMDGGMRMVKEFPLQFRRPAWGRSEGEVLRIGVSMHQLGIDIREGVGEMDGVDGMEIYTSLKA